jgi:glycosidase
MRTSTLVLLLVLLVPTTVAQPVTVDKVEPPNWWTGMEWNEVQLMLYGEHLDGLTARFKQEGPDVTAVHTVPNASYSFVDVHIPEGTQPGQYELILTKGQQRTSIRYPIRAREHSETEHQGFGPSDTVYLITPDRFANGDPSNDRVETMPDEYDPTKPGMRHGGDLQGIIDHLDYLQDLGVTTLWLNPVLENRGENSYHGYATTDYYRVDPRFGTNAQYKRLVDEAHRRGLKVIFDHINNHIGIEHPWIGNLPRKSWLNGSVEHHHRRKHYKMSVTDPHADPESEKLLETFWFVDSMPDLNQRDPLLADYLIQNTLWWIEYSGLDGIREDTYPYPDQEYMADWAEAILTEYPDFNIVGEIWEDEPAVTAMYQAESRLPRNFETNLPTVMDFALSTAFRDYLRGDGKLQDVYKVFAQDFLYTDTDNLMTLMDNHDMPRGIYVADGNTQKLKQVLTMLLTTRGIPQILYGTEINMMGGESHVELREDFPGGFPDDERNAFTEAGRTAEENDVFNHLQTLLHLRNKHAALTQGRMVHYPPTYQSDVYTYVRSTKADTLVVAVNGHEEARSVDLSELSEWIPEGSTLMDLLTNETVPMSATRTIDVGKWDALVLDVQH